MKKLKTIGIGAAKLVDPLENRGWKLMRASDGKILKRTNTEEEAKKQAVFYKCETYIEQFTLEEVEKNRHGR